MGRSDLTIVHTFQKMDGGSTIIMVWRHSDAWMHEWGTKQNQRKGSRLTGTHTWHIHRSWPGGNLMQAWGSSPKLKDISFSRSQKGPPHPLGWQLGDCWRQPLVTLNYLNQQDCNSNGAVPLFPLIWCIYLDSGCWICQSQRRRRPGCSPASQTRSCAGHRNGSECIVKPDRGWAQSCCNTTIMLQHHSTLSPLLWWCMHTSSWLCAI